MSADQIIDAERNVLSVLFCDKDTSSLVFSLIRSDEVFTHASHRLVFNACKSLYEKEIDLDHQSVTAALAGDDKKDARFVTVEVAALLAAPSSARFFCESLLNAHALRKIGVAAKGILKRSAEASESADELLSDFEREVSEIRDSSMPKPEEVSGMWDVLKTTFEQIEVYSQNRITGGVSGVSTGFNEINEITCGLTPGDLIVLAARPSMGKTAFCTNVMRNIAARGGSCLFFSVEMSKVMIGIRLLAGESGVSAHTIRRGLLTRDDFTLLTSATGRLEKMKILVDDRKGITTDQIVETTRRVSKKNSLSLVVIDYLGLIRRPGARNANEEIGDVTRELKIAAGRFNVPIMLLCQLSRKVEDRGGDRRPQLADLRDSGNIEQDADLVAFLYRPDAYFPDPALAGKAEFILAKNRNGPTGTVPLRFDGKTMNFRDYAGDFASQDYDKPPF